MAFLQQKNEINKTGVQRYRCIRAGAFKIIRSLLYLDCLGFVCFSCSHSWFPQKEIWASDWGKLGELVWGEDCHIPGGGELSFACSISGEWSFVQKKIECLIGETWGKFGIQKGVREQLLHAIPVAFRECNNFLLHFPVFRRREDFCFSFPLFRKVEV